MLIAVIGNEVEKHKRKQKNQPLRLFDHQRKEEQRNRCLNKIESLVLFKRFTDNNDRVFKNIFQKLNKAAVAVYEISEAAGHYSVAVL